jgi:hypothetical protein
MLLNDRHLFDALGGAAGPTLDLGEILDSAQTIEATKNLLNLADQARARVAGAFKIEVDSSRSGVVKLDQIIKQMWETGWSAKEPSFNLFCTDFGALYSHALLNLGTVVPVFRSISNLDHTSFWHPGSHQEFFPFRKVAKALSSVDGESLSQMWEAVGDA